MAREAKCDRLRLSPIHLLHRAGQCAGGMFDVAIRGRDVTPRQLAVAQHEGLSQTDLVEHLGSSTKHLRQGSVE